MSNAGHPVVDSVYSIGGVFVTLNSERYLVPEDSSAAENSVFVYPATAEYAAASAAVPCIYVYIAALQQRSSPAVGEKIFSQQRACLYRAENGYIQQYYLDDKKQEILWKLAIDHEFSRFNYFLCADKVNREESVRLDPWKLASTLFLLQHSFINHQGLIIHAAGGSVSGKGLVFSAPSGTGKSTLSRLLLHSPDNRLFSEERLIIRSVENKWQVWGTPWHGEGNIARNESAPLSALVFLRQAQKTEITRLSPADGLHRLVQTASIPWYSKQWTEKGLALCERLIQDIPIFELAFRPDRTAVQAVERLAAEL
ncbi:MAG: hypothetical protein ACL93V_17175 [Candidatus Electrothrix sp. YB6]